MATLLNGKWLDSSSVSFPKLYLATDPAIESDGTNGIRVKVKSGGGITRDSDGISVSAFVFNEAHDTTAGDSSVILYYVPAVNSAMIFLNGLLQRPGASYDYTMSDRTVSFTATLGVDVVMATYLKA